MKKTMVTVITVAIMAFAIISISEAATNNEDWSVFAGFAPNHNSNSGASYSSEWALFAGHVPNGGSKVVGRDANRGSLTREISTPAYTDYIDARVVPTTGNAKGGRTPEVTGAW